MSYILDALKQSERRRNRRVPASGPAAPAETPPPPAPPFYRRRLPWLLLMLLLALPVGYLLGRFGAGWLGLSTTPEPPPQAQTPLTSEPASHMKEPAEAPPARTPVVIVPQTPRILVEAPPAVSLNEPQPGPRPETAPPAPEQTNAATAALPAKPERSAAPPEPAFDPGVPDIRELPAGVRSRLPALTLSVHIYSPDAAARMVNINGQMLREGQNMGQVGIERITPRGVVLRFQGNDFHLGSVGG
ncbi:general secretion pathway protein GspB [Oceanimonas pelagia]|uniref:General secretion pathway protein GspB n=1 Tax=Oceanimonas pelagia TaxID=3028314 RepID=A0AA50QBW7_9GAMM|nr:general secretion pathway protein GspB [Oceanimonas pelagia]WMC10526.1 general secretion pathway protein GspB [Oceanimonas pelagia]